MREKEVKKLYHSITDISEAYVEEAWRCKPAAKKRKRFLLMAACLLLALALCGFGYAISVYWGVGSASSVGFDKLTNPFGTVNVDKDSVTEIDDNAWARSDIITDYTNIFADNSVCYALDGGTIPALYFSPGYMIIFTQEDESGWTLSPGEEAVFELSLNDRQNLELEFGYVLNGRYSALAAVSGHEFSETFKAPENGEYYFCVTNRSSENAVIVTGAVGK